MTCAYSDINRMSGSGSEAHAAQNKTKVKKKRRHPDDDEDYCSTSSLDERGKPKPIPKDTSSWTPDILDRLHLHWDKQMKDSPDDVLDMANTKRKQNIPNLTDELEETANYIAEKIDIDLSYEELAAMDYEELETIGEKIEAMQNDLRNSAIDKPFKGGVHTYGYEFLEDLKKLIFHLYAGLLQHEPKQPNEKLVVPLLEKFCKICGFLGNNSVVKRSLMVNGLEVVSIPDLEFVSVKLPFLQQVLLTISIAEVKKYNCDCDVVYKEKRKTRAASETAEFSMAELLPVQIKGSSQHVGQLLLEARKSAFLPWSFGLLFSCSKAMMTCLEISHLYIQNVADGLKDSDKGTVYYSDMYDILKAEDRKKLVKAFLRLGRAQSTRSGLQ